MAFMLVCLLTVYSVVYFVCCEMLQFVYNLKTNKENNLD